MLRLTRPRNGPHVRRRHPPRFSAGGGAGGDWAVAAELVAAKEQGLTNKEHDDRSVIMIFNLGAPSQMDTFDPKPEAAAEIRGPFEPISTKGGFQITEILPRHAAGGRQVLGRAVVLPHGGGRARHGAPDAADRPALHRRRQHAARRLCAGVSARAARPTCRRT